MTYKIARVGDHCTHGATVITGKTNKVSDGKLVATIGDLVNCPLHGVNEIISSGAEIVNSSDKKTAHVVSMTKCGAQIITGSDSQVIDPT